MLTLALILFLLFSTLLIVILSNLRGGRGYAWMAALLAAIIAWAGTLAFRWLQPEVFALPHWRPYEPLSADPILFRWDAISWPYGFALVSLGFAVIFTAPARFSQSSNPQTWAANLAFTGLGLAAVLAATPLSLVFTWTVLDLVELVFVLGFITDWRYRREAVTAFAVRLFGTFLLIAAMVAAHGEGLYLTFEEASPSLGVLILGAVIFRLGVIPLNLAYVRQLPLQHGLTNTLRIAGVVSALIVLARIPRDLFPETISPFFVILITLGVLYGAVVWLTSKDEIRGRPYWLLSLTGLAVLSTVNGYGQHSVVWGAAMVISGGVLFLFSARSKNLLILPILGLIGFLAFPFTPSSAGWLPFSISPFWVFFLVVVLVILGMGYLRHATRSAEPLSVMESWGQALYTLGLFVLIVSAWLTAVFGLPGGLMVANLWAGLVVLILMIAFTWLGLRTRGVEPVEENTNRWPVVFASGIGNWLGGVLQFGWLFKFFETIFQGLQRLVFILTGLLEGQGGVLWALLLLALLFTILGIGSNGL